MSSAEFWRHGVVERSLQKCVLSGRGHHLLDDNNDASRDQAVDNHVEFSSRPDRERKLRCCP